MVLEQILWAEQKQGAQIVHQRFWSTQRQWRERVNARGRFETWFVAVNTHRKVAAAIVRELSHALQNLQTRAHSKKRARRQAQATT